MSQELRNFNPKIFFQHRKIFRGDCLKPVLKPRLQKWHFHSVKWTYWPGCLNTVGSCRFVLQKTQKLPKNRYFDISKAPPSFTFLKKLFGIAYNSYITRCRWITGKPNLISFSEQFYEWKSWNLRQLRPPSIQFWALISKSGLKFFIFQLFY